MSRLSHRLSHPWMFYTTFSWFDNRTHEIPIEYNTDPITTAEDFWRIWGSLKPEIQDHFKTERKTEHGARTVYIFQQGYEMVPSNGGGVIITHAHNYDTGLDMFLELAMYAISDIEHVKGASITNVKSSGSVTRCILHLWLDAGARHEEIMQYLKSKLPGNPLLRYRKF